MYCFFKVVLGTKFRVGVWIFEFLKIMISIGYYFLCIFIHLVSNCCPFFPLWPTIHLCLAIFYHFSTKRPTKQGSQWGCKILGLPEKINFQFCAINSNLKFFLVNTCHLSLFTCHMIILIWNSTNLFICNSVYSTWF